LFRHFSRPDAWQCDPDAAEVLPALAARGLGLGLASNYDHRLRSVVAGWPALASVPHLVISAEVGWRKPAPEFFAAVCTRAGVEPKHLLLVGDDRDNDYEGALAFGCQAVLFDPHERATDPVRRIRTLRELLDAG
jgi:putative hydrolase of the HAD superfamily